LYNIVKRGDKNNKREMASIKELYDIANILRRDSLKMTTEAESGHATSCLSCAEIMSVLFFREMAYDKNQPFNPDNDEFILSKGHAAPILYSSLFHAGCINENLLDLRKLSSPLEGHPVPSSKLRWVKAATGSLGQGLSVGLGMALASKLQKRKFRVYVLLGDSEISEGEIYEALQLASYYKLDNLVAIVDVNSLGQRGETMLKYDVEKYKKRFQSFGWNVFVVDGHNVTDLISSFLQAKKSSNPVMILAKTIKGKGVSFLENKDGWHGKALSKIQLQQALNEISNPSMPRVIIKTPEKIRPYNAQGESLKRINYFIGQEVSTREAYGDALLYLSSFNKDILAVDGEVSNSTKSEKIKNNLGTKNQFIEAYIAEQNMIGMSLGLSIKGFNVFASTFSAFLSRAYDQIRMAAISQSSLNICGGHSGVSIGKDGVSQMGLEDIAFFRTLPESFIFYPSDAISTIKIMQLIYNNRNKKNIKYIRTTRDATPVVYNINSKFSLSDFNVLQESKKDKIVLIGAGITLHECLKAHYILKAKGINSSVIDLYCIKPFNTQKLINFVDKHGNKIIIAEDHYKQGGIGEMIASGIPSSKGIALSLLSIGKLPHSGAKEQLLSKYKIDAKAIAEIAEELLTSKSP